MNALADNLSVPVIMFNQDISIMYANDAAMDYIGESGDKILKKRWGEALKCVNQGIASGGCGSHETCRACGIRNMVGEVFTSRKSVRRLEEFLVQEERDVHRVQFVLHGSFVTVDNEDYVLMVLDDITDVIELKGIVHICAVCKKVKTDATEWQQVEDYLARSTGVMITHTVCPSCVDKHYP